MLVCVCAVRVRACVRVYVCADVCVVCSTDFVCQPTVFVCQPTVCVNRLCLCVPFMDMDFLLLFIYKHPSLAFG